MVYISKMTKLSAGDWLTLTEAAVLIGITKPTLSVAVQKGLLPAMRVGRQVMILKADAENYKKNRRKPGRPKNEK